MRTAYAIALAAMIGAVSACNSNGAGGGFGTPPVDSFTTMRAELKVAGTSIPADVAAVTPAFFPAAHAQPILGRFLIPADGADGAGTVIVVSDELWRTRFDASRSVIGQAVQLDGRTAIVIGLAPPRFSYPGQTAVWTPRTAR